jgi:hypothetical protein
VVVLAKDSRGAAELEFRYEGAVDEEPVVVLARASRGAVAEFEFRSPGRHHYSCCCESRISCPVQEFDRRHPAFWFEPLQ